MKVYLYQSNFGYDGTWLYGIFSSKAKADHLRRRRIVELIREMKGMRDQRAYVRALSSELEVLEFTLDELL